MKLYIVGNGFDLWHRLPTSYDDFYEFSRETLDEVENYFHLDLSSSQETPWHDFENRLGKYHWRSLFDEHNHTDVQSDDFKPSHVYSFEDELVERADELVEAIQTQFKEWVDGIDASEATKRISFDRAARFLTFNYTSTLQQTYGIEDEHILHIHGRAGKDELTFGHGEPIEEEGPEYDPESGESNRTMFTDAEGSAKYPLYAFKKQVNRIIRENRSYFESLNNVSEIAIIGHSLNDVDLPYFREIAARVPACRWAVYCYLDREFENHPKQLVRCGVGEDRISTRAYDK